MDHHDIDHTARYHLDLYHRGSNDVAFYRSVDKYINPCFDDDCTREHVHILTDDYRALDDRAVDRTPIADLDLSGLRHLPNFPTTAGWSDDHGHTDGDYSAPSDRT